MNYQFKCYGHKNILATHKTTLEFTADKDLTLNGDCIMGIKANFDTAQIRKLLKFPKLSLTLHLDNLQETIYFTPNPEFFHTNELVIRLSKFSSPRTLGIDSDKAAIHINRKIIEKLKNPKQEMLVVIESYIG